MSVMLSKSEFNLAKECEQKLSYKKLGYVNSNASDAYMQMLAEGGFLVGEIAKLVIGVDVEIFTDNTLDAVAETIALLDKYKNITIAEASFMVNGAVCRVDVLKKVGNVVELIEVKSKSYNSEQHEQKEVNNKKYFDSKFKKYIQDLAFQTLIVSKYFGENVTVLPYLCLPDTSKTVTMDNLISLFNLKVEKVGSFNKSTVEFLGSVEQLKANNFLTVVPMEAEVKKEMFHVEHKTNELLKMLETGTKPKAEIGVKCKGCEFAQGQKECWNEFPNADILELGYLGKFNNRGEIDNLIENGLPYIAEVPKHLLENKYNNRPYFQQTLKTETIFFDGLRDELNGLVFPLHFVDFETISPVIPYHSGMRPFQKMVFQFSVHTLHENGTIEHKEWVNTVKQNPNVEFAFELHRAIGENGSIMVWSPYENVTVKEILAELVEEGFYDTPFGRCLQGFKNRTVDMNNLTLKYYFHPEMGGKTSIKVTLPAILSETKNTLVNELLKADNLLRIENGKIVNPYTILSEQKGIEIHEGTGAMKAYNSMVYSNTENAAEYKQALLKYCKLDTLAMVLIYYYWIDRCNE